jgi:hypothetical protein
MPRMIERDYIPMAQAQNRAVWRDLPPGCDAAYVQKAAAALEATADRQQAAHLQARRDRLAARINRCIETPALFWNERYFRNLRAISFASTGDAVREVQRAIAYERNLPKWRRRGIMSELREALVFARFFRRHSGKVWNRRAA